MSYVQFRSLNRHKYISTHRFISLIMSTFIDDLTLLLARQIIIDWVDHVICKFDSSKNNFLLGRMWQLWTWSRWSQTDLWWAHFNMIIQSISINEPKNIKICPNSSELLDFWMNMLRFDFILGNDILDMEYIWLLIYLIICQILYFFVLLIT